MIHWFNINIPLILDAVFTAFKGRFSFLNATFALFLTTRILIVSFNLSLLGVSRCQVPILVGTLVSTKLQCTDWSTFGASTGVAPIIESFVKISSLGLSPLIRIETADSTFSTFHFTRLLTLAFLTSSVDRLPNFKTHHIVRTSGFLACNRTQAYQGNSN